MTELTEKQFLKAVGKIDKLKHAAFLQQHPIEYTDEWIYEFQKYLKGGGKGFGGGFWPEGSCHGGLDHETSGFYGQAMYIADRMEDYESNPD